MEQRPAPDEAGDGRDAQVLAAGLERVGVAGASQERPPVGAERGLAAGTVGLVGGEDAHGQLAQAAPEVGHAERRAGAHGRLQPQAALHDLAPDRDAVLDVGDVPEEVGPVGRQSGHERGRVESGRVVGDGVDDRDPQLPGPGLLPFRDRAPVDVVDVDDDGAGAAGRDVRLRHHHAGRELGRHPSQSAARGHGAEHVVPVDGDPVGHRAGLPVDGLQLLGALGRRLGEGAAVRPHDDGRTHRVELVDRGPGRLGGRDVEDPELYRAPAGHLEGGPHAGQLVLAPGRLGPAQGVDGAHQQRLLPGAG